MMFQASVSVNATKVFHSILLMGNVTGSAQGKIGHLSIGGIEVIKHSNCMQHLLWCLGDTLCLSNLLWCEGGRATDNRRGCLWTKRRWRTLFISLSGPIGQLLVRERLKKSLGKTPIHPPVKTKKVFLTKKKKLIMQPSPLYTWLD